MHKSWVNDLRVVHILVIVLSVSFSTMTNTSDSNPEPTIHDLVQPFLSYWKRSKDLSIERKVERLKKEIIPLFPEFYNTRIERWSKRGKTPDKELASQINEFPLIEANFTKKANELSQVIDQSLKTFINEFPEMNPYFDIYVIHSLGEMDGGTRQYGKKNYFILGIDGMVKYHKDFTSEVPFFHHELFHVYHGQYLTEDMIFWIALWGEGLATYTAEKLNPHAPIEELMLSKSVITNINKNIEFYWKDILAKLESRDENEYEKYFLMSSTDKKIVNRAGYYLGYLIAKEAGKTKSMSELVKLKPDETVALLKRTIDSLRAKTP
jgi:hypothetical protein